MSKRELLDNLFFGNVDSESEEELDKIFIQTKDFKKFLEEKTAVVIGAKGAGKALYIGILQILRRVQEGTQERNLRTLLL